VSAKVCVIDYGIGNVFSVCNALAQAGADASLTRDRAEILAADRIILPGVGAFKRAMEALNELGLSDTLKSFHQLDRPFLGICIGMQVMMETSEEFGLHEGLGFFKGKVSRINATDPSGKMVRVPHISWAPLSRPSETVRWENTPLNSVEEGQQTFYYVHSYHCLPNDRSTILAESNYEGQNITASIRKNNTFGLQFHPERSGKIGHQVLREFINI